MRAQRLLTLANISMGVFLTGFVISLYGAYGMESHLPLMAVTLLHILQIVLAGLFKVAYVVRLIAQSLLGQELR